MLNLIWESQFKKDIKVAIKRNLDLKKLESIIKDLQQDKPLPSKNRTHKLLGNYMDYWECHVEPDCLLVYKKTKTDLILARTGTHSDLF